MEHKIIFILATQLCQHTLKEKMSAEEIYNLLTEPKVEKSIGKMCTKFRNEISFNGIKFNVLKSAIQKYARRGNFEKGVWCLIEMDLFLLAGDSSKALRTNMINRLICIMTEDIGPADFSLPIKIKQLYEKWQNCRNTEKSRKYLIEMYWLLCKAEKIRLVSDVKAVFDLPPFNSEQHDKLHLKIRQRYPFLYEGWNDCKNVKEKFVEALENKSDTAFLWLRYIDDYEWVWKQLNKENILYFFWKKMTHKERPLYLYHAICLVVYERNESVIENFKENVAELYDRNLSGVIIELDDFVYDLHTGNGKSKYKFAIDGAYVEKECKKLYNPLYRKIYHELKMLQDGIELPDFEIKTGKIDLSKYPHAQKRTAERKKAVFIVDDKVWKGPYKNSEPAYKLNIENTINLKKLEDLLELPNWKRSCLMWDFIWQDGEKYYFVAKNIGNVKNMKICKHTTKVEENIEIVDRESMVVRMLEYEKGTKLNEKLLIATLQHLYLRFLLGVGDSSPYNVLIRQDKKDQLIVGNDMEEVRKLKGGENKMEMLFSKHSKLQRELYMPLFDKITTLSLETYRNSGLKIKGIEERIKLW